MANLYDYAVEVRDYAKIEKLNKLTNPETFWDDVRKLTKNVYSDHSIGRWQILAEARFRMLAGGASSILVDLLNAWVNGRAYNGIKMPNSETFYELADISRGIQTTTINAEVIKVFDYCGIEYTAEGTGWRVTV